MTIIGIDPSLNSTGVCIKNGDKYNYILITSKQTKKQREFKNDYIDIICYEHSDVKDKEYNDREEAKTSNIYNICQIIKKVLMEWNPEKVIMEGVSYGSIGSAALVDLSGLQFAIRMILREMNIPFLIISPKSLKKGVSGNGQADKDLMVYSWKKIDRNIEDNKLSKLDDLADAFFLANYETS